MMGTEDNIFIHFLDTLKSWIYKFGLVIFFMNMYVDVFGYTFLKVLGIAVLVSFIIDLIVTIVSVFVTSSEGEWTITAIINTIINIALLITLIVFILNPNIVISIFKATNLVVEKLDFWWVATCIIIYNLAHELITLPLDLIGIFSDPYY